MGQLSQQVGLLKSSMASIAETASRTSTSSSDEVSIEVTEESTATDVSAVVEVLNLASKQSLSFIFDTSVTLSTEINQASVSLNTEAWDSAASFEIDSDNATLTGLTEALNEIDGINASLLYTGTGYALIIKSEEGTENALDDVSIDAIKSVLQMTDSAVDGTMDAEENPLGVTSNETEAQNASLLVDGISVVRSSNVFEDLFAGHKITLNAVGTSTLSSSDTSASVKDRVTKFLAATNELKSYLSKATQRGINGAEPGPLAGDVAAKSILDSIRNITTQPITGFGDDVYLAQIGIMTAQDGTLTLNEERFAEALAENPDLGGALFTTTYGSPNSDLSISGLSFAPPQAGTYDLVYDSSTATATLDGQSLTISTNSNGNVVLRSNDGDTEGITITLGTDESLTTTVRYGQSLADQLQDYSDSLLGTSGLLARRETALDEDLLEFETQIEDIDSKVAQLTERYNIQFGRMEAVISSLKRTGEYMQSMMDSWIASK
ncbi:putative flagellar hook-associated protein2 (plasmid) [Octadecabacter arcticus 238]|uniref:Putative flagellar hook-associated protein2 n=2 Tax=Octadecabacter arcticus TaxID=53946 RepID=M9RRG0_9RHOB|nr:putative flagellar hook-associated protein2 [Octadecabacter arcticus 238]